MIINAFFLYVNVNKKIASIQLLKRNFSGNSEYKKLFCVETFFFFMQIKKIGFVGNFQFAKQQHLLFFFLFSACKKNS